VVGVPETFERIVCGVDGTPGSLEAARQAERLRSPDGTLRLVAVAETNTAVHAGFAMSHVLDELNAAAREGLQRASDEVKPASMELLAGDPAPRLLDEIERTSASLVAVGSRGHRRAVGILIGGVATQLLHNAPCSVLVARPAQFGEFPTSIIAGVDGSEQSIAAAVVAGSIADRFGSELVIVTATSGKDVDIESIDELSPNVVTDLKHPVRALSDLAREADLLVLGSRGLHGLRALGSVSERAAHQARCSVLVVR
jgi:nucleotide-binding universal stress UspA family protein